MKGQEHPLTSESPKNYLYSEYVFQETGAWIIHSYSALISLCGYQYANSSSVGIQNTLHAHKESMEAESANPSKTETNTWMKFNCLFNLLQIWLSLLQTLKFSLWKRQEVVTFHLSLLHIVQWIMFFLSVFELFMDFNVSYL